MQSVESNLHAFAQLVDVDVDSNPVALIARCLFLKHAI